MIQTNDFPGAEIKKKKLISVVNEYNFEDIAKAIFCICVCVNNRSVLESTLALNWALAEHDYKGNMLELVRFQKKELPMVAGAEEVVYSSAKMIVAENAARRELGVYADIPIYSIPYPQIKKMAAIKNHIWGL